MPTQRIPDDAPVRSSLPLRIVGVDASNGGCILDVDVTMPMIPEGSTMGIMIWDLDAVASVDDIPPNAERHGKYAIHLLVTPPGL